MKPKRHIEFMFGFPKWYHTYQDKLKVLNLTSGIIITSHPDNTWGITINALVFVFWFGWVDTDKVLTYE